MDTLQGRIEYKTIPLEDLVQTPSRLTFHRNRSIAESLTAALSKMVKSGWNLTTSCKTASGTLFVFERPGSL